MIAIHYCVGTFSDRWIQYCKEKLIPHIVVDMFSDDFFDTIKSHGIKYLLAHPQMADRASLIAARSIINSCETAGISVFPSHNDFWHFDDKIAQKYLFEFMGIKTPKTHVFFNKEAAIRWARDASYPVVFKLKAGAGSVNVSLLKSRSDAQKKINQMFGKGLSATDGATKDVITKIRNHRAKRDWLATIKRLPITLKRWYDLRQSIDRERGYIYFQEFIDKNDHDIRVVIIGERAFAFRRMVRPGDFRASGSGVIDHSPEKIEKDMILYAFDVAKILGVKCIAFDFVRQKISGDPLIVEMSFGFVPDVVHQCPGHWNRKFEWNDGHVYPQDAILNDMIEW